MQLSHHNRKPQLNGVRHIHTLIKCVQRLQRQTVRSVYFKWSMAHLQSNVSDSDKYGRCKTLTCVTDQHFNEPKRTSCHDVQLKVQKGKQALVDGY